MSTLVGSFLFARLSGCRAVIAGPDIKPAFFMAEASRQIVGAICPPATANGTHVCPSAAAAATVLPTVLVGCVLATLLMGVSFFLLGALRLTGVVGFVPANVTAGFFSCVGYKVLKAALEVASGVPLKLWAKEGYYLRRLFGGWDSSWKLLLPSLVIGLLLYLNKRWHKVPASALLMPRPTTAGAYWCSVHVPHAHSTSLAPPAATGAARRRLPYPHPRPRRGVLCADACRRRGHGLDGGAELVLSSRGAF